MTHLEVSAWMESILQSQGAKPQTGGITKGDTVHYNLVRCKKQDGRKPLFFMGLKSI
ncbi:Uncharacterised protein [uncultured Avibacterium sp.]|uniref:Uncharacterized protein n=1 Tax=uncultured Avibacterium sp. TaxID=1936169 RepID=A0A486XD08_9PAST|nr:Uncharacterised protein [uncultured Avibacterium sp.]